MFPRVSAAALVVIASMLLLYPDSTQAAANKGSIEGVVKSSSGQPVSGAFVKFKNNERRLTLMVISQAQGRYAINDLPPGKYIVQAVGSGMQSDWTKPVEVAAGKTGKADLSLTAKQAAMLAPAWPGRMPEAAPFTLPEGEGKKLVSTRCVSCHDAGRFARTRTDRERWKNTVEQMRGRMKEAKLKDLTDQEAETAVNYLATSFPPLPNPDANSRLPRTLMQGAATKYRVVQYTVANPNAETHDVAVDPKGRGWTAQRAGKVGSFDPVTWEYTEISPPPGTSKVNRLGNPQINAKGIMWFPDGPNARWLSYDTNTGKWEVYDWPKTAKTGAGGNSVALHQDGTIWASGAGASEARMLNPKTREWKFFEAPTYVKTKKATGAYGITVDGAGKVWFAQNNIDQMAKVDPVSGKVEEFKIPLSETSYPRRMNTDAAGDVWVGLWSAGKLMKIDHKINKMTFYTPPNKDAGAYSVSVDKKNNLIWVSLQTVDKIARFNPKTEEWVEFPLPEAESDTRRIEVDPNNPNRIWYAGNLSVRLGFIEILN